MEITEVRVKLVEGGRDKLRAFCSITIDDSFVVRDLKIIDGTKGLFVAMPSRKLTTRCARCGFKNQVRSNYCNDCGTTVPPDLGSRDGRGKMHADIAHPIHTECRERLQSVVVESYLEEVEASQKPGYRPRDLDEDGGYVESPENVDARTPVLADRTDRSEMGRVTEKARPERLDRGDTGNIDGEKNMDREKGGREIERSVAPRGPITDLDRDPRGFDSGSLNSGSRDSTPRESDRSEPQRRDSAQRGSREAPVDRPRNPDRRPSSVSGGKETSRDMAPTASDGRSSAPGGPASPGGQSPVSGGTSSKSGGESSDSGARSSTPARRPLSEMPPPDDNFSAGIF